MYEDRRRLPAVCLNVARLAAVAATLLVAGQAMAFPSLSDDGEAWQADMAGQGHMSAPGMRRIFEVSAPHEANGDPGVTAAATGTAAGAAGLPVGDGLMPGLPDGFVASVAEPVAKPTAAPNKAAPSGPAGVTAGAHAAKSQESVRSVSSDNSTSRQADARPGPGGLLLPFGPEVGAAMLRYGDLYLVYIDTTAEIALPSDRGPFIAASVERAGDATLLRLTVSSGSDLRLCRVETGWLLSRVATAPCGAAPGIGIEQVSGDLHLRANHPGRVVASRHPFTGQSLLIATARDEGFGRVEDPSTSPSGSVLRTEIGIVLAGASDAVQLERQVNDVVVKPWGGTPAGLLPAGTLTRLLRLPHMDAQQANQRLVQAQLLLRGRGSPTPELLSEAAEAAIGTGDGWQALYFVHQAQALPTSGSDDEARRIALLGSAAHALESFAEAASPSSSAQADRPSGGSDRSDEAAIWRLLSDWQTRPSGGDACHHLQQAVQLLSGYPTPLRTRLLPEVGAAFSACGNEKDLDWLAQLPDDGALRLAKAIGQMRRAAPGGSLDGLDRLIRDPDPVVAYRAEKLDIDHRVERHQLDARAAADRMEPLVFAARMAGDEDAWRQDLATLRLQAGQIDQAIEALRLLPAGTKEADALTIRLVQAVAGQDKPADMVGWNNRLLKCARLLERQTAPHISTSVVLAEALLRGGLARKAIDLVSALGPVADDDLRLRILNVKVKGLAEMGDLDGARAALSGEPATKGEFADQVAVLQARIAVQGGDCADALHVLDGITAAGRQDSETLRLHAFCLTKTARWAEAEVAWRGLLSNAAPSVTLAPADQETVLRYLEAAARAGDAGAVEKGIRQFGDQMSADNREAVSALQKTMLATR